MYQPEDCLETRILGRFPMRNQFISDYIFCTAGRRRSAKQVGSRLQQLRDTYEGKECEYWSILWLLLSAEQLISQYWTPCLSTTTCVLNQLRQSLVLHPSSRLHQHLLAQSCSHSQHLLMQPLGTLSSELTSYRPGTPAATWILLPPHWVSQLAVFCHLMESQTSFGHRLSRATSSPLTLPSPSSLILPYPANQHTQFCAKASQFTKKSLRWSWAALHQVTAMLTSYHCIVSGSSLNFGHSFARIMVSFYWLHFLLSLWDL